ncbi:hypothetical protein DY218_22045 [Streptomyces triticagri]|uniref:Uncharacterized protein n=1 Tax=Streptomyces triticagri TaxID=2293568 RepID=A0A372M0T0_9ACTN|nr:hypothetical protein DY218_22045 [Streptomyces triticagri]
MTPITTTTGATMDQAYQWVDSDLRSRPGVLPGVRPRPRAPGAPAACAAARPVSTAMRRSALLFWVCSTNRQLACEGCYL